MVTLGSSRAPQVVAERGVGERADYLTPHTFFSLSHFFFLRCVFLLLLWPAAYGEALEDRDFTEHHFFPLQFLLHSMLFFSFCWLALAQGAG